jgi:hypothetical protein
MKLLSAGLTFFNFCTIAGLILGIIAGGLGSAIAGTSLILGIVMSILAYFGTIDRRETVEPSSSGNKYGNVWLWLMAGCFAVFAFRSFCWLIFTDSDQIKVQSINNLGDLPLHITYLKTFANGVALWPDNPIYVFGKLRYPVGVDLFNALLVLLGIDMTRGLVWTALLASLATFYAFWRWGGVFGIAGFLFNGGIAGFTILETGHWIDYQGDQFVAWKSIPLAMFVTQRGLLYAIPAGLLLLYHWRAKFFAVETESQTRQPPLPFWVEMSLYASMPLYHMHTFLALTIVLGCFFLIGNAQMRKDIAVLLGSAFVPATFFVFLITDRFSAGSMIGLHPGWVQNIGDFKRPFFTFWFFNFGIWGPLVLVLIGFCVWREWNRTEGPLLPLSQSLAFLFPATVIFILILFIKFAPWEWDNLKVMIWGYFIVLPFLWTELIARAPVPLRIALCIALFGSGFVSLFGGLATNREGFGIGSRAEVDGVGAAVQKLPVDARFAAFPTYKHPLLLQGRRLVLGYPGHLWTQGYKYGAIYDELEQLMKGAPNWRQIARSFDARYVFWGREEKTNYPTSTRPWERESAPVASGEWGAIYDLQQPRARSSGR